MRAGLRSAAAVLAGVLLVSGCASTPPTPYAASTASDLQRTVLHVTEAAGAGDLAAALVRLSELEVATKVAHARGEISAARSDSILSAIALVRADLEALIATAEREAEEAAARKAEEEKREAAEAEKREAEEAAKREAAEAKREAEAEAARRAEAAEREAQEQAAHLAAQADAEAEPSAADQRAPQPGVTQKADNGRADAGKGGKGGNGGKGNGRGKGNGNGD